MFRGTPRSTRTYTPVPCTARVRSVGLVQAREYAESVRRVTLFLEGRSDELSDELNRAMEAASERLDFEEAARLRDQVAMIRTLQARQYVEGRSEEHTSELQSLMRISYAVFCLKKKKIMLTTC